MQVNKITETSVENESFVSDVTSFTQAVGCTTDQFNARQTALYIGLQLEEMAEKLDAVQKAGGGVFKYAKHDLEDLIRNLHAVSGKFKQGEFDHEVGQADRHDMLDADIDLAWVTIGSALSQGADVLGAAKEVARSNLSKVSGGVVKKDANGKVMKPAGWTPPDLKPFVCSDKSLPVIDTPIGNRRVPHHGDKTDERFTSEMVEYKAKGASDDDVILAAIRFSHYQNGEVLSVDRIHDLVAKANPALDKASVKACFRAFFKKNPECLMSADLLFQEEFQSMSTEK